MLRYDYLRYNLEYMHILFYNVNLMQFTCQLFRLTQTGISEDGSIVKGEKSKQ